MIPLTSRNDHTLCIDNGSSYIFGSHARLSAFGTAPIARLLHPPPRTMPFGAIWDVPITRFRPYISTTSNSAILFERSSV